MTADSTATRCPGWTAADARHLEVALATATGGWPVFPCSTSSKRPALPRCQRCEAAKHEPGSPAYLACAATGREGHGFYDATTDEARIRAWWGRHPQHLMGVPTAGLVVMDLDWRPPAPDPWAWWQALCDGHGHQWWVDLLVETPSNGVHVYFTDPTGEQANIAGLVAKLEGLRGDQARTEVPQVDTRATGGYVIAPGSRLPDGREYRIIGQPVLPRPVPTWLVDLVTQARQPDERSRAAPLPAGQPPAAAPVDNHSARRVRYGQAALEQELGRLAQAPEGQRNDQLNRSAHALGQLAAGGHLDPTEAADRLYDVALRIGLSASEAAATIRSGINAGARNPRNAA